MKPHEILKKVKEVPSKLRNIKLPRSKKTDSSSFIQTPSGNSPIDPVKDKMFAAGKYLKNLYYKARKADLTGITRIVLAAIIIIYIIGGVILSQFAYSSSDKKGKSDQNMKVTKRDIWVGKFAKIYPLPAVSVNGEFVSLSSFYRQVSYIKNFNKQVPQSLSKDITDEKSLRLSVLDNIIEAKVVAQEAKKNKITLTQKDIDAAYKVAADANGGPEQIDKVLKELYGMSPAEFKILITDQLYREKIREKLLVQVHIKHILLTDKVKADAALARIQKGETFEAVAASASEDSNSKDKGGDLGWLGRDDLRNNIDADFEKAVFALKKGETSGVIKSKYGYHIVKLEDKKGSIDKSFTDWLQEVKKKASIKKYIKS